MTEVIVNFASVLLGIEVTEYPDIISPFIVRGIFHFGEGTLKVEVSETVSNSLIDLSKIKIYNNTESAGVGFGVRGCDEDSPVVTIKLVESQRISLLKQAGTLKGMGLR